MGVHRRKRGGKKKKKSPPRSNFSLLALTRGGSSSHQLAVAKRKEKKKKKDSLSCPHPGEGISTSPPVTNKKFTTQKKERGGEPLTHVLSQSESGEKTPPFPAATRVLQPMRKGGKGVAFHVINRSFHRGQNVRLSCAKESARKKGKKGLASSRFSVSITQ